MESSFQAGAFVFVCTGSPLFQRVCQQPQVNTADRVNECSANNSLAYSYVFIHPSNRAGSRAVTVAKTWPYSWDALIYDDTGGWFSEEEEKDALLNVSRLCQRRWADSASAPHVCFTDGGRCVLAQQYQTPSTADATDRIFCLVEIHWHKEAQFKWMARLRTGEEKQSIMARTCLNRAAHQQ